MLPLVQSDIRIFTDIRYIILYYGIIIVNYRTIILYQYCFDNVVFALIHPLISLGYTIVLAIDNEVSKHTSWQKGCDRHSKTHSSLSFVNLPSPPHS